VPSALFRRNAIKQPHGNLTGLKPSQLKALERLYRRRISPAELITLELARELVELSAELRRQVGLLVNRGGEVAYVLVGNERSILIPDLSDYPLGKRFLRGLRLIHTHLKGEALSDDDLTDLALLRLDLIAALQLSPYPGQFSIQTANVVPPDRATVPYQVEPSIPFTRFSMDFAHFIDTLERSLSEAVKETKEVTAGAERGILISVTKQSHE